MAEGFVLGTADEGETDGCVEGCAEGGMVGVKVGDAEVGESVVGSSVGAAVVGADGCAEGDTKRLAEGSGLGTDVDGEAVDAGTQVPLRRVIK